MKNCKLPRWWTRKRAVKGSGPTIALVLICIFGAAPTEMAAQESLPVEPGVRVRVTAPDCSLRGQAATFRALRVDTLVLETTECPLSSVTRLDVSRGERSQWARGLGVGFLGGALIGAVYGGTHAGTDAWDLPTEDAVGLGAAFFGVGGGLVGGIAGYFIKADRWEEVPLERLSVSLAPQRDDGFALGFSVTF